MELTTRRSEAGRAQKWGPESLRRCPRPKGRRTGQRRLYPIFDRAPPRSLRSVAGCDFILRQRIENRKTSRCHFPVRQRDTATMVDTGAYTDNADNASIESTDQFSLHLPVSQVTASPQGHPLQLKAEPKRNSRTGPVQLPYPLPHGAAELPRALKAVERVRFRDSKEDRIIKKMRRSQSRR